MGTSDLGCLMATCPFLSRQHAALVTGLQTVLRFTSHASTSGDYGMKLVFPHSQQLSPVGLRDLILGSPPLCRPLLLTPALRSVDAA